MVDQIDDLVDIVEIGTPMIVREGMVPVKAIKGKFPHLTVLADTKIVDGGFIEANIAIDAGADIVTVLALASDATIRAVVKAVKSKKRYCLADMLYVEPVVERALELEKMGVDTICLHTAVDEQSTNEVPLDALKKVKKSLSRAKTALAGGINMAVIQSVIAVSPDIIIVGSSLTSSPELRNATLAMKAAISL
jgi:3-hexulose-6-phosphate synthase